MKPDFKKITASQLLVAVGGAALVVAVLLGLADDWVGVSLALLTLGIACFSAIAMKNQVLRRRSRRDQVETVRRLRQLQVDLPGVVEKATTRTSSNVSAMATLMEDVHRMLLESLSKDVSSGTRNDPIETSPVAPTDVRAPAEGAHAGAVGKSRALPEGPIARPDVTAAVILDPFSELAFRYEWRQILLTPGKWREQIKREMPDLLFLESAWRGNRGAWRLAMTAKRGISQDLIDLVKYCRSLGIPTVFWNKEDPPNYDRFIAAARLVDHVFTVDADKIPDYKRDLGHDRVHLLPFAAQPRIHNPIQSGEGRSHDVAFAGSYFAERHDARREQMEYILAPAREFGLEIFSRMQGEDERYQFPKEYRPHIVGSLPYEEMLEAYARYRVFLNVNTVTESPSMCSRRLFELSAAGTPVLSGPARSISRFFGDDVLVAEDAGATREILASLLQHEELRARIGLKAHRRVMNGHTYGDRVDEVLETIGLHSSGSPTKASVSMVVPTRRPEMLENIIDFAGGQVVADKELVLVAHGFTVDEATLRARLEDAGVQQVVVLHAPGHITLGACMNLGVDASAGGYVAKMDDDNYYGPNYLADLLLAFRYTSAEVVGKWAHYAHLASTGATLLRFPHAEHRYSRLVQGGTLVFRRETALDLQFEDLPRRVDTTFLDKVRKGGGRVYSADRFNFVSRRGIDASSHTWTISDRELLAKKSRLEFYGDPVEHVTV